MNSVYDNLFTQVSNFFFDPNHIWFALALCLVGFYLLLSGGDDRPWNTL
jgi:hypothetical protein